MKAAFPGATILRPSIVFGREDQFVNRFAAMIASPLPVIPVLKPDARFQPVHVVDVARAAAAAVADPKAHGGRTYELGGPDVLTMLDLHRWIAEATGRDKIFAPLPDFAGSALASLGKLPGAPITRDQWLMLQRDNVVANGAEGFEAFGIAPTPMAAVAPGWLVLYRRQGRFGQTKQPA